MRCRVAFSRLRIERAEPEALEGARGELRRILRDAVESGASVGFVLPLGDAVLDSYLDGIVSEVAAGGRIVLLARDGGGDVVGTVQLGLAERPNSLHRAEVQKLLVHRSARRRGLGRLLMHEIEAIARAEGRTLLVLDTLAGSDAERLYVRLGWSEAGRIPEYAGWPDGRLDPTVVFFKLLGPVRRDPELAAELAQMAALVDRRGTVGGDARAWERVDVTNTDRLKEIVARHGWPGRSLVGDEGAEHACLLAERADRQLDFQRRALELLRAAVEAGEATPQQLAQLTDRVRVNEGLPQRYGTQIHRVADGAPVPFAVEEPERLDERRASAGLEPWAEFAGRFDDGFAEAPPG